MPNLLWQEMLSLDILFLTVPMNSAVELQMQFTLGLN